MLHQVFQIDKVSLLNIVKVDRAFITHDFKLPVVLNSEYLVARLDSDTCIDHLFKICDEASIWIYVIEALRGIVACKVKVSIVSNIYFHFYNILLFH